MYVDELREPVESESHVDWLNVLEDMNADWNRGVASKTDTSAFTTFASNLAGRRKPSPVVQVDLEAVACRDAH